jgi:hypothetical protein
MPNLTKTPAPIADLGLFARDQEQAGAFLSGGFRSHQLMLHTWIDMLSRFRHTCALGPSTAGRVPCVT